MQNSHFIKILVGFLYTHLITRTYHGLALKFRICRTLDPKPKAWLQIVGFETYKGKFQKIEGPLPLNVAKQFPK